MNLVRSQLPCRSLIKRRMGSGFTLDLRYKMLEESDSSVRQEIYFTLPDCNRCQPKLAKQVGEAGWRSRLAHECVQAD